MSNITIKQLAKVVGVTDQVLLEKLKAAGIPKQSGEDIISDAEKNKLLSYIQSGSTTSPKVGLKRNTGAAKLSGQHSKVNVQVKKKKISLKKDQAKPSLRTTKSSDEVDIPTNIPKETPSQQASVTSSEENTAKQAQEATDVIKDDAKVDSAVEKQPSPVQPEYAEKTESDIQQTQTDEKATPSKAEDETFELPSNIPESAREKKAEPSQETSKESASKNEEASTDQQTSEPDQDKSYQPESEHPKKSHAHKTKKQQDEEDNLKKLEEGKKSKRAKGQKKRTLKEIQLIDDADLDEEELQAKRSAKAIEKKNAANKVNKDKIKVEKFVQPKTPVKPMVELKEEISVAELAQKMAVKSAELIKSLMKLGMMVTQNQTIDQETAVLVLEEMGYDYKLVKSDAIEDEITVDYSDKVTVSRAPVVTIMGHVDHGKTSLLDYIRKAKVTATEAGGITQHIGAYSVETDSGQITFLDTPGHQAFTAMRARGAGCTDVVIIVVAADDGVMPQTIEAVQHTKAAGVPMIVAVNKIDKEDSDPDRVKNELSQHDVIPEEWGGDVIFTHVSAITGEGVDTLLENVLLQSELLELEAVSEGNAQGVVVEAKLEKGRGPVATVLVQSGCLKKGDMIIAGLEHGRVRRITNDKGKVLNTAGPSTPVEIIGLSGTPSAGDEFTVVDDEKKAREVAEFRQEKMRQDKLAKQQKAKLTNIFENMGDTNEQQSLSLIVKADAQGSVEAICDSLEKLSGEHVKVNILSSGTGGITSSDITLASASEAVIFGFNVRADSAAKKLAEKESVEIRYYSVIYDLIDDVKQAMQGLLSPEVREKIVGIADVRDVFRSSRLGAIAGCMVIEGVVKKNNPIRVLRDQVVIYEGKLESLRRYKDDYTEVKKGLECGIGVKNYNDVKPGDQIEVFETYEIAREI